MCRKGGQKRNEYINLMANIDKIKYYPDRFYIGLDGFDLTKLFVISPVFTLTLQQAVFMHEYYHYLTNISTFQGVRSFHAAFCDLFRLVCRLTHRAGLNAFPVNGNQLQNCVYDIDYWNSLNEIFREDNVNGKLSDEVEHSQNRKFSVNNIATERGAVMTMMKNGQEIKGQREFVRIDVDGLPFTSSFRLSLGAMDEFLSASIDEFVFEHSLADNKPIIDVQPYYPYRSFDEILRYYGLRLDSRCKILIVYYAMHGKNPAIQLRDILECIKAEGQDVFEADPCQFLSTRFEFFIGYDDLITEINKFVSEAESQGRKLVSKFVAYYLDRFITAQALLKKDIFFFVRPFLVNDLDNMSNRQDFILAFDRIRTCFPEPVILQDKVFSPLTQYNYGADLTVMGLAIYEIMDSLETNQIAKRLTRAKDRYDYPDGLENCDDVSTFTDPPLMPYWHKALNELGLYQFYRDNVKL